MVEFILELVVELVFDVILQLLVEIGWETLAHSTRRRESANLFVSAVGYALIGAMVGLVSLFVIPGRVFPPGIVHGGSLLLSPIATGLLMHVYGEFRRSRNLRTTHLATFWGGAIFAFAMALVRFLAYG